MAKRFVEVNAIELDELTKIKKSKNTENGTKTAVNTFEKFLIETNICDKLCLSTIDKEQLQDILCKFYAGSRTEKGELYKVNALHALRNGLRRHFLEKLEIDVINDESFISSNTVFQNMLAKVKHSSKGITNHFPEIEPEDIRILSSTMNLDTPEELQEKVWFDAMFYLIRRGRENLRSMTKETFSIDKDATGKRYVFQRTGELDKNHTLNDREHATIGEGRMYETGTRLCPVESFIKYVGKLNPSLNDLWQRPKDHVSVTESIWYCNVAVGEKTLGSMMATMSIKYKLSQRYTNHSIRVTSMQSLEDAHSLKERAKDWSITKYVRRNSI